MSVIDRSVLLPGSNREDGRGGARLFLRRDTFSRDPLRRVVKERPLFRVLANGVKVHNRYELTLDCGCVVERQPPVPKSAVCREPSHPH